MLLYMLLLLSYYFFPLSTFLIHPQVQHLSQALSPFFQGSSHSAQCIQTPNTLIIALIYPSPTLDSEVLRSETMADCILVSNTVSAAYYIFKTCLINKWMSKPSNIPGCSFYFILNKASLLLTSYITMDFTEQ